jgi:hypothetical protein
VFLNEQNWNERKKLFQLSKMSLKLSRFVNVRKKLQRRKKIKFCKSNCSFIAVLQLLREAKETRQGGGFAFVDVFGPNSIIVV